MSGAQEQLPVLREDASRFALAADLMTSAMTRRCRSLNARLHAVLTSGKPMQRRSGGAAAQVLTAFVNVSRLPKGSVTDTSREPQGVSSMPGRA